MSQRRITAILIVIFLLFGLLEVKLFSLQILNGSYYKVEAQKRSMRIELIPALRGKILDRNGKILAEDKTAFDMYIVPAQINKKPDTIPALAKVLGVKKEDVEKKFKDIINQINRKAEGKTEREAKKIITREMRGSYKIWVNVSLDTVVEIEANPTRYPGVFVEEKVKRAYLYDDLACHIIGYMGQISSEEYQYLKKKDYFVQHMNPMVDDTTCQILEDKGEFIAKQFGRFGVEKSFQEELTGVDGVRTVEMDFINRVEKELSRFPPTDGKDIYLTIDAGLQKQIETLLKDKVGNTKAGSVIVMDVTNGEILAMASAPGFNPNLLQSPVSKETVDYIFHHPKQPLFNRVIAGQYAPGSLFKIVTATAGLQENKISSSTYFNCDGYYSRSSKHFKCWIAEHNREHGSMNVVSGLQHSCNVFFFNTGRVTGEENILGWAARYGYGKKSGIDLKGEVEGLLPSPEQKLHRYKQKWAVADTLNISIGQGDLMVTPIQVVRMMAAVANDGLLLTPRIIKNDVKSLFLSEPSGEITQQRGEELNISNEALSLIRRGLYEVVHSPGGTANGLGLNAFPVAGKTSTAETGTATIERLPHAWFTGFAPYDPSDSSGRTGKPRFAFVVMIEQGGKGSATSVPITAGFMETALNVVGVETSSEKEKDEE
ncbi:MAG: penicillin-binding protein 2 [Planctomycetes bacterium]|nr:penicillin-binding protein 2 [Planctomycetota bacterium]